MRPHRPVPISDVPGKTVSPVDIASLTNAEAGRQAERGRQPDGGSRAKGQVFRRKIDCGSSTETSAERLILRDPDHLLRASRRSSR